MSKVLENSILFASMIFLVGCAGAKQTYKITDVTKESTIILRNNGSQQNVSYILISGEGNIDGEAEISLILDDKPYKTERISGNAKFSWNGDWYSEDAKIEYKPSSVKGGDLNLEYQFK
ncbi:MAG: hypothetical protein ACFB02_10355 [Mastigocoleus sp.]